MNKFRLTIKLVVIATFLIAFASVAQAQATRTWVSGVGDDANPCSRTAPCKTFAGAISKTATAGEINVLDPGGFGGVTITKSITISSEGFEAGVLVSGTNAIIINAPLTAVVILRGLDIEGLGTGLNGINILQGKTVIVEDCTIHGFSAASTNGFGIKDARTQGGADIPMLFVKNCEIRDNRIGIGATGISPVLTRGVIENTRIHRNTSNGALIQQGGVYSFRQCNISGNTGSGVRAENTSQVALISSIMTNNQGIAADNGGTGAYSLADVTIMNNITSHAGTITTFGNNNCRNNANNINTNCALPAAVGQN
jgi:hypothetical protein